MHPQATESASQHDVFEASEHEFHSLLRSLNVQGDVTSTALFASAGLRTESGVQWRLDIPDSAPPTTLQTNTPSPNTIAVSSEPERSEPRIYAPIPIISKSVDVSANDRKSWKEADTMSRVLRLMESQQQWYDAARRAAEEAASLLELCEHHQEQWLQAKRTLSH